MVNVNKLKFDKNFKELFSQEPEKVERIAQDMKEHGFDKSQPIIVTKDFLILDGNSRYLSCQKAGISVVPVKKKILLIRKRRLDMSYIFNWIEEI